VETRARHHVVSDRTTVTSSAEQKRLLGAFIAAAHNGDVTVLENLFTSDVVSTSDKFVRAA
jgi:RNA polymerase sigma-70 factor (ECF subfamily)